MTRRAIVTGATRRGGAGHAVAGELLARGLDVVLTHHLEEPGEGGAELALEFPDRVRLVRVDLEDPAAAAEWARGEAAAGPVAALVHNASAYSEGPPDPARVRRSLAVHAESPLAVTWELREALSGGSITLLADSALGVLGRARRAAPAYSVGKAALLEVASWLAVALAPRVRVNSVAPGLTSPRGWTHGELVSDAAAEARLLGRVPLGRRGSPWDVASAVAWLALEAGYVTGQVVRVDGGRSAPC